MRRCFLLLLIALPLSAQTSPDSEPRWHRVWSPPNDLYAPYVADPRRSRHIIGLLSVQDSNLPDSQNLRWGLSIGGTYGLLRVLPPGSPQRAWQLDVEARFYAQYDIHYALDEIGHDGRLGMMAIRSLTPTAAARLGFIHTSSHVGDEYLLRNHLTERNNSRREELSAGLSWTMTNQLRTYADFGYGINLGPRNRPVRIETGIEFEDRPRLGTGRWYAAFDATSFEENDYDVSVNLQTGILFQSDAAQRKYRFGIELYDGRSQLDAFFPYHERYAIVGMWLDL